MRRRHLGVVGAVLITGRAFAGYGAKCDVASQKSFHSRAISGFAVIGQHRKGYGAGLELQYAPKIHTRLRMSVSCMIIIIVKA